MRYIKQLHNKHLKYHLVTSTQQGSSRMCRETYLDAEVTYLNAEGFPTRHLCGNAATRSLLRVLNVLVLGRKGPAEQGQQIFSMAVLLQETGGGISCPRALRTVLVGPGC